MAKPRSLENLEAEVADMKQHRQILKDRGTVVPKAFETRLAHLEARVAKRKNG